MRINKETKSSLSHLGFSVQVKAETREFGAMALSSSRDTEVL